jgi:cystathionine beta-lyase/cystathionine gamma-synthase
MDDFGGVVTFVLSGDLAAVERFMNALTIFTLAESLGGVESLVGHPATMSHSVVPQDERLAMGIPDTMIRLSIGIEHADDLIADLDQALAVS